MAKKNLLVTPVNVTTDPACGSKATDKLQESDVMPTLDELKESAKCAFKSPDYYKAAESAVNSRFYYRVLIKQDKYEIKPVEIDKDKIIKWVQDLTTEVNKAGETPSQNTKLGYRLIINVISKKLYSVNFSFEGMISVLGSTPFQIKTSKKKSSRIEMAKDKKLTISKLDLVKKFSLSDEVAKAIPKNTKLTDFMIDIKTKEFAVGVQIDEPLNFLEAVDLGFVKDYIDITTMNAYIARTLYTGKTPTTPPTPPTIK